MSFKKLRERAVEVGGLDADWVEFLRKYNLDRIRIDPPSRRSLDEQMDKWLNGGDARTMVSWDPGGSDGSFEPEEETTQPVGTPMTEQTLIGKCYCCDKVGEVYGPQKICSSCYWRYDKEPL